MKITRYIMMLAAAVGLTAGCQKDDLVTFDPAQVTVPELNVVEDILISKANLKTGKATFSWEKADFGIAAEIFYSIEVAYGDSEKLEIITGLGGNSSEALYSVINDRLYLDLGIAPGMPVEADFYVAAKLNDSEKFYSEPVKVTVTCVEVEKKYPMVYVLGQFNGWSHDTAQHLFNFAETGSTYQGIIGLGNKGAEGFKITGAASWDDATGNWGGPASANPEPETLSLSNGSLNNITCFSKPFYHFTFDTSTLLLTKNMSFSSIKAVIGSTETEMKFDEQTQKFFLDTEINKGDLISFRYDNGTVLGGQTDNLTAGGAPISYPATGTFRILLNLNNSEQMSVTFDSPSEDGGGNQGGGDDPSVEVTSEWGIVGADINNWGDSGDDLVMTDNGTYIYAKGISLKAQSEFKFRTNNAWGTELTVAGGSVVPDKEYATIDGVAGAPNLTISETGVYDIYLTSDLTKVYFMREGKTPEEAEAGVIPPAGNATVKVYCAEAYTNLYVWVTGKNGYTAWPGARYEATENIDGTTYKRWTLVIPASDFAGSGYFILNDGAGNQTSDSDAIKFSETMFITVSGGRVVLKQ